MAAVLSVSDARTAEGDSAGNGRTLEFTVSLSEAAETDVSFTAATLSGTADRSVDFVRRLPVVTIPQGETVATVAVDIVEDTVAEGDESMVLELTDITGATFEGGAPFLRAQGIIEDDDGEIRPALFVSDPRIVEGNGGGNEAVFTVTLSRPFATDVSIPFQTIGSTATAGADFTAVTGTVDFPAGQTETTVSVPVATETLIERRESFDLVLDTTGLELSSPPESAVGTATILDDDAGGGFVPVLTISDDAQFEGNSSGNDRENWFLVELSGPAATDVTYRLTVFSGTGEREVDVVETTRTVTIPAGETARYERIDLIEDAGIEGDENYVVELSDLSGAVFEGAARTVRAEGVILDDDTEDRPALFVSDPRVVEGAAGMTEALFEITLSRPFAEAVTIPYQTVAQSAVAGQDFVAASGSVAFLPGQTRASVAVEVVTDTAVEPTEGFDLVLDPSGLDLSNGVEGAVGEATILDDDAGGGFLPVLSIQDGFEAEGDSAGQGRNMQFVVALSAPAATDITLTAATFSGSADEDIDFVEFISEVTIEAGRTTEVISVGMIEDTAIEGDESFRLELSDVDGAVFEGNAPVIAALGIVGGDDSDVRRAVFLNDIRQVEGDTPGQRVTAEVVLSRPADTEITIPYTTVPRGGASASDFTGTEGVVTFLPGQTRATIAFTIEGDTVSEPSETVDIVLSAPEGDAIFSEGGSGTRGTLTILDDDASDVLPVLTLGDAQQVEGNSAGQGRTIQFPVFFDRPLTEAVTFDVATSSGTADEDVDFNRLSDDRTVQAGNTAGNIIVNIIEDTALEPDEAFTLTLSNLAGAVVAGGGTTATATGTILNDDGGSGNPPVLVVEDVRLPEPGAGQATATFTVFSSGGPVPLTVTGDFEVLSGTAEAGVDFGAASGQFTIPVGSFQSQPITVPIFADAEAEGNETFIVQFDNLVNGSSGSGAGELFAIGVIEDTAPPAEIRLTNGSLAPEGDSGPSATALNFGVARSGDTSTEVTVDYAVTGSGPNPADAADFPGGELPSGTLTIRAGRTFEVITIRAEGDTDIEEDEGFIVTLSNPTNGAVITTASATGTIQDDDGNADPVAMTDLVATPEGTPALFDLAANDTDPDGDALAVSAVGPARDGTVSVQGGQASYTPDAGFRGTDSFLYEVGDGVGGTDVARAFVTVGGAPDPARQDGIVRGLNRDDVLTLSQNATYLGRGGDDVTILSEAVFPEGTLVVEDTSGTNTIQLVEGLLIAGAIVSGGAIQLTLGNNSVVQILGATEFLFDVGGNATTGTVGEIQDFDTFVADTLAGGPFIVGEDPDMLELFV